MPARVWMKDYDAEAKKNQITDGAVWLITAWSWARA
jgi:hypothetical protein